MGFNCFWTQAQFTGNLAIIQAVGDQLDHLQFTFGECVLQVGIVVRQRIDNAVGNVGAEIERALCGHFDGVYQIGEV